MADETTASKLEGETQPGGAAGGGGAGQGAGPGAGQGAGQSAGQGTGPLNGGALVAEALVRAGVPYVFTLCGGHISPILVEAKRRGVRIVDMRDEKHAVFAADAVARMTGVPGVAAVTAGPGVTNTITALKNAQMAQSPVVLLGGAAATVLKGRGSLQDIEQLDVLRSITKWAVSCSTRASIGPTLDRAFRVAQEGVPGPVFVELPIDLLYDEAMVREWYMKDSGAEGAKGVGGKLLKLYLEGHLLRQFRAPHVPVPEALREATRLEVPSLLDAAAQFPPPPSDVDTQVASVARLLKGAKRPVLVVGSQALVNARDPGPLAEAIRQLDVPTYLAGTARGLLGRRSPLQLRHNRGKALKEADLVVVAGFPFDFRLGYGRGLAPKGTLVSVNLSAVDLRKNRRPDVGVRMHPGDFLQALSRTGVHAGDVDAWRATLKEREAARDAEIAKNADPTSAPIDPVHFFLRMEEAMAEDAVLVVDGGDFVATAAYTLRPRAPLGWLDPGVFGTLGVGGGYATGAALVRPGKEVWLIYGDGSSAYSLSEFDTYVRHGLAPIAVIGNDASWGQIARDQVAFLGDAVGTVLTRNNYHLVAEGYGGKGLLLDDPSRIDATLAEAKALAAKGTPVCINVHIARSEFRKGSISM
jgi:acetolactate synthase-1/2/3 large subunit